MKKIITAIALASVFAISGCRTDADVVNKNISKEADNFKVQRRIVFYNGITNEYILEITGKCSMDLNQDKTAFHVICKTGDNEYKKHTLVLSDNVTAFVEQLDGKNVSADHYKVIFKPSVIVPEVEMR